MYNCERSILTLGSQVPSAYPAIYEIQREAKKNTNIKIYFNFNNQI